MTVNLPTVTHDLQAVALWAIGLFCIWFWLRKDLTPARFLSIFETDGVLSSRQLLAWVLAIYGMAMRAAGRLDNDGLDICLQASFILFGIGGAVKLADKIKPATTVNANNVQADVTAANVSVSTSTPSQTLAGYNDGPDSTIPQGPRIP